MKENVYKFKQGCMQLQLCTPTNLLCLEMKLPIIRMGCCRKDPYPTQFYNWLWELYEYKYMNNNWMYHNLFITSCTDVLTAINKF